MPVDGCGCHECCQAWALLLSHRREKAAKEKPLRDEYQRLLNELDKRTERCPHGVHHDNRCTTCD